MTDQPQQSEVGVTTASADPPPVAIPPVASTPTPSEQLKQLAKFEQQHPQITLGSTAVAPQALNAWTGLQTAVSNTLAERLNQSQAHRSKAWAALSRV